MILQFKGKNVDVLIEIVETGERFETRTECAKKLGVSVSSVSNPLNGFIKSCAGYHLRYVEGYIAYYLTQDVLDELSETSSPYEEWWYHPEFINVFVSTEGQVSVIRRKQLYVVEQYPINSGYLAASIYAVRTAWIYRHLRVKNTPPLEDGALDAALLNPGMILFTAASFAMAGFVILYL